MSGRKLYGKYDWLLFAVLLAAAVIIYCIYYISSGRGAGETVCEIKLDGKIVMTVNLSEPDCEFELPQNPHIRFRIKNHAIAFIDSDCPDKVCVHTGYLRNPGQSAACLPNRVSIHIVAYNGEDDIFDIVAE